MVKIRRKGRILIVLLAIALLLPGCSLRYDPPSAAAARKFLTQNREDIYVIVDFLKELDQDFTFIDDDEGTIFYEFDHHEIPSAEVKASIRRLWQNGCVNITKNDLQDVNTINFEIWYRTIGDVDCGIACTIDGEGTPKTEFQIMHEEIGDGWFYYFDDYEEYRTDPSKFEEYQPWTEP